MHQILSITTKTRRGYFYVCWKDHVIISSPTTLHMLNHKKNHLLLYFYILYLWTSYWSCNEKNKHRWMRGMNMLLWGHIYTFLQATKTEMIPLCILYLYLYMTYHTLTSQSSTEEFAIITVVYTSLHYIVRLNTIHLSQWLSSSFFIMRLNFDLQNELQNISCLLRLAYSFQKFAGIF